MQHFSWSIIAALVQIKATAVHLLIFCVIAILKRTHQDWQAVVHCLSDQYFRQGFLKDFTQQIKNRTCAKIESYHVKMSYLVLGVPPGPAPLFVW
jgi:hypothetical protein